MSQNATVIAPATKPLLPGDEVVSCSPLTALVWHDGRRYTITASVEMVSPQMAEGLLDRRNTNRASSPRRIDSYARAMEAGKWRLTNQGIGLDALNRLVDGEHRCRAVLKAGRPALMLVVRGLPPEAQAVVDFNRVRSASDQSIMTEGMERGKDRLAAASVIRLLVVPWADENVPLSPEERLEFAAKYARELDWAISAFSSGHKQWRHSAIVGAWAYAYGADPSVARWVPQYLDGIGLERGDPLVALRNVIINRPTRMHVERRSLALKALRVLWAKRNGETLQKAYDNADGAIGFMGLRGDDASKWDAWTSYSKTFARE